MKSELRSGLTLLLAAAIWGFAMAAQRQASLYLSPFTFNACRFTIGAAAMLPLLLWQRKGGEPLIERRDILPGVLMGLALALASLMQQSAVGDAGAGKAGFLTALYVVLVPVLSIFLKKSTRLTTWLSLLLALPALYLLCVPAGERFSLAPWDLILLMSAFVWSIQILLTDHFARDHRPLRLCLVQFLVAGALDWVFALTMERPAGKSMLLALWPILYCGVFSTGVGYLLQTIGQKGCRPAFAALILSLESVFCVIAGALLLGEKMDTRGYIGCALMLCAVVLAQAGSLIGNRREDRHV